jgi:hypothetical protein
MMMDFNDWFRYGRDHGFIGGAVCVRHEPGFHDEDVPDDPDLCLVAVPLFEPETAEERAARVDRPCARTDCDSVAVCAVGGRWYCHRHGVRVWKLEKRLGLLPASEDRP